MAMKYSRAVLVLLISIGIYYFPIVTLIRWSYSMMLTPATPRQRPADERMCILGAGPAGISAAVRLKDKGYTQVVVFEKNAFIGGKTRVDRIHGHDYNMGAVTGIYGGYALVEELVKRAHAQDRVYFPFYPWQHAFFEGQRGEVAYLNDMKWDGLGTLWAVARYCYLHWQYEAYLKPGYAEPLPAALDTSVADYLADNDLEALTPVFLLAFTTFGYGHLGDVPAVYALTYIPKIIMVAYFYDPIIFLANFQALFQAVAAHEKLNVQLNQEVTAVQRSDNMVTLTLKNGAVEKCRHLIVAYPPVLKRVQGFDLDTQEKQLLSQIKMMQYATSLIRRAQAPRGVIHAQVNVSVGQAMDMKVLTNPHHRVHDDSHPVHYERHYEQNPDEMGIVYSFTGNHTTMTVQSVQKRLLEVISKMNRDPSQPAKAEHQLKQDDIVTTVLWDYFPHVTVETIREGFFQEFEKLQGHRNTYWSTAARCFEDVEEMIRCSYDIVDRFF